MITVVVVTYNHEKYIAECLDSILSQKIDEPLQILVGDDQSTDSTASIVKAYSYKYPNQVFPIIRRKNMGSTKNLLELVNRADGEYIAFCDGDDYWSDTYKLEKQLKLLNVDKKCSGCVSHVGIVDENGQRNISQTVNWLREQPKYTLAMYEGFDIPGHLSSLVVKNNGFINKAYNEGLFVDPLIADRYIFLAALVEGHIRCCEEELSVYRFIRGKIKVNAMSQIYRAKKSWVMNDLTNILELQKWLLVNHSIKKKFVKYKSQLIVTLLFQKLKGYNISFYDFFKHCDYKFVVILRLPLSVVERIIYKCKFLFGNQMR